MFPPRLARLPDGDGIIYNAIALVAFLAFVPGVLLAIAIQQHLSRGLTMGAVKG
jgi:multiple sugar transport system permease protein